MVIAKEIATSIEPFQGAKDRMTFVRISVPATARLRPEGETITIHTDHKRFGRFTRRIARYKRLPRNTSISTRINRSYPSCVSGRPNSKL